MLYLVTLTYVRPIEEVNVHLDGHRDWLVSHMREGRILVAGPLEDRTGGFVLARCASREELDGLLAADPFVVHRLVDHSAQGFTAALRAQACPAEWAPGAKSIP
ncbi:YciI family protein [Acidovorax sp. SUPP2539]|uniref:YciI family protein n=1 Tax=Acidovorax sp. SUPP2539 TaxID=2920878 RepID=UPI0023DE4730|nr:YciI family protein [Acidovorax sp. SUPP2539]GKS88273.1 YciI family protein [Acidovorax sp. SUPP2539]